MAVSPTAGCFLLATSALEGSWFEDKVIFLVEHQEEGSFGLVINQSARIPIDEVFSGFQSKERTPFRFFFGGPVQEELVQILEVGQTLFPDSPQVGPQLWLRTVEDHDQIPILDLFANSSTRIFLGYSGWTSGQLEAEVMRGCWEIVMPNPVEILSRSREELFATPSEFKKNFALL